MVAIDIGIIIGGLVILCFGGYALVLGSVALAKKLQISSIVIGLTVEHMEHQHQSLLQV